MKRIVLLILSVVMMLSFSGCGKKETANVEKQTSAVNVKVEAAKETSISDVAVYTGEVKASASATVSAKASGTAKTVKKEIGDYVEAGEVLATIDDTDYRIQYNQALAAYNQVKAQYNSIINGSSQQTKIQLEATLNAAKIEYNNAEINYNNQKILYENGAVSKSVYDAAVTRFENAKLNLETAQKNYDLTVDVLLDESATSAKASLDSAKVQLEAAQNMLNNTVIKAPISGYIASRNTNVGQIIAQGVEIFSIKSTNTVDVQINVTESVISYIVPGAKATVNVKAAGKGSFDATVTNVGTVKDMQTGMYKVIVEVNEINSLLKDGMFADVEITLSESSEALVISAEAILEDEDGTKYVYVADGNNAKRVDVVTGITTDEKVEIISGISTGDKVIVSGKEYLSDKNTDIRIVE